MLHLVWLQFKHTWKIWMSSLIVFLTAGFLTGICLTGLFSVMKSSASGLITMDEVMPIFLMPMVFGGITLFFVIGGVIRLMIHQFREEYILWTILGSKPTQLALLIGGQLAIVGAIGGTLGYTAAFPFTNAIYYWMQNIVGTEMLPTIPINFSLPAFLLTILFVFLLAGLGGIKHSRKLFINVQKDIISFKMQTIKKTSLIKKLLIVLCLTAVLGCYFAIFTGPSSGEQINASVSKSLFCFALMFLLILLFNLVAPLILPLLIKVWTVLLPREKSAPVNTAFWNVLARNDYLLSIIVPIITGSLLLSGFSSIMTNVLSQTRTMEASQQNTENMLIFILYLGAPLLIILANVLAITFISSQQQAKDGKQLSLLGFSSQKLTAERSFEALIYSVTFFLSSLLCNFLVSIAVVKVATILDPYAVISWGPVFFWPILLSLGMMLVLCSINQVQLHRVKDAPLTD